MKVAIEVRNVHELFGGDFAPVIEFVKLADAKGIDQVVIAEHVVVHRDSPERYPGSDFPPVDYSWYEPVTVLAGLATVTKQIRLSMGVLISPLRSAVLLAKQLATLDVLSGGRLDAGFGAGWQKEEFEASGIPFEGRFTRLEEQVFACRALWRDSPAAFAGKTINFEGLYCSPRPVRNNIPVWLGVGLASSQTAFERIARCADGWIRTDPEPDRLGEDIKRLRATFAAHGRDPGELTVRSWVIEVRHSDGTPDVEATLSRAKEYAKAGVDILEFYPGRLCRTANELAPLLDEIMQVRRQLS